MCPLHTHSHTHTHGHMDQCFRESFAGTMYEPARAYVALNHSHRNTGANPKTLPPVHFGIGVRRVRSRQRFAYPISVRCTAGRIHNGFCVICQRLPGGIGQQSGKPTFSTPIRNPSSVLFQSLSPAGTVCIRRGTSSQPSVR